MELETYRAVIREPHKAPPEPDKYGTLTIPGSMSTFGISPVPLRQWAQQLLPTCAKGSWCDIYKVEERFIERVDPLLCSEKP